MPHRFLPTSIIQNHLHSTSHSYYTIVLKLLQTVYALVTSTFSYRLNKDNIDGHNVLDLSLQTEATQHPNVLCIIILLLYLLLFLPVAKLIFLWFTFIIIIYHSISGMYS